MEYILSVRNGMYYLVTKEKHGNSIKRDSTNNQEKISYVITSINTFARRVTEYNNMVKFHFGNGMTLTLKDYASYKNSYLYKDVCQTYINENTRIMEGLEHVNLDKLKKILLTSALALCVTGGFTAVVTNTSNINVESQQLEDDLPNYSTDDIVVTTTPSPTVTPTPIPTVVPSNIEENISEFKTFDDRINDTILMLADNRSFASIPLGTRFNDKYCERISSYSNSDIWQHITNYGSQFGVDPYLGLAVCYAETNLEHEKTIPGGSAYNGYGVGIGQHESPSGDSITAFNYSLNSEETVIRSMENACDLEMNIKMTIMLLQKRIHRYHGNIYLAIQSYNYGPTAMTAIINAYASELNCSVDEVLENYEDTGWLKYVEDLHLNPQKYIKNWKHKTYGNPNYIKDVLGYYIGTESINRDSEGNLISLDLITLQTKEDVKIVDKLR